MIRAAIAIIVVRLSWFTIPQSATADEPDDRSQDDRQQVADVVNVIRCVNVWMHRLDDDDSHDRYDQYHAHCGGEHDHDHLGRGLLFHEYSPGSKLGAGGGG